MVYCLSNLSMCARHNGHVLMLSMVHLAQLHLCLHGRLACVAEFSSQITQSCGSTHSHTHTYIHTHSHTHTYIHTHTHTHTYIHTHTHTHTHSHTHIHTHTHTHTYIHTYTHTYTHTLTHTHTYIHDTDPKQIRITHVRQKSRSACIDVIHSHIPKRWLRLLALARVFLDPALALTTYDDPVDRK